MAGDVMKCFHPAIFAPFTGGFPNETINPGKDRPEKLVDYPAGGRLVHFSGV
jgi:hypothetical protein